LKFSEEQLRKLALIAISELGENASPDKVKSVVSKAVENANAERILMDQGSSNSTGKIILTAFGLNRPGIISAITKEISVCNCDIHDLSQKIMDDFFTMIMIVDITNSIQDFKDIQERMSQIATELNIKIYTQHEDIFRAMHRL